MKDFEFCGTPLSRSCIFELVKTYVDFLTISRQEQINFRINRPGKDWMRVFLKRYNIRLKSPQIIESDRADAMIAESVAAHFARLEKLCAKYSIRNP